MTNINSVLSWMREQKLVGAEEKPSFKQMVDKLDSVDITQVKDGDRMELSYRLSKATELSTLDKIIRCIVNAIFALFCKKSPFFDKNRANTVTKKFWNENVDDFIKQMDNWNKTNQREKIKFAAKRVYNDNLHTFFHNYGFTHTKHLLKALGGGSMKSFIGPAGNAFHDPSRLKDLDEEHIILMMKQRQEELDKRVIDQQIHAGEYTFKSQYTSEQKANEIEIMQKAVRLAHSDLLAKVVDQPGLLENLVDAMDYSQDEVKNALREKDADIRPILRDYAQGKHRSEKLLSILFSYDENAFTEKNYCGKSFFELKPEGFTPAFVNEHTLWMLPLEKLVSLMEEDNTPAAPLLDALIERSVVCGSVSSLLLRKLPAFLDKHKEAPFTQVRGKTTPYEKVNSRGYTHLKLFFEGIRQRA